MFIDVLICSDDPARYHYFQYKINYVDLSGQSTINVTLNEEMLQNQIIVVDF